MLCNFPDVVFRFLIYELYELQWLKMMLCKTNKLHCCRKKDAIHWPNAYLARTTHAIMYSKWTDNRFRKNSIWTSKMNNFISKNFFILFLGISFVHHQILVKCMSDSRRACPDNLNIPGGTHQCLGWFLLMKRDDRPLDIMEKEKQPAQASFEIPQLEENLSIVNWTDATVNLMIGPDDGWNAWGEKAISACIYWVFWSVEKWSKMVLKCLKSAKKCFKST